MVMLITTAMKNSGSGTYNNDNNKRFHKYKETMTNISSLWFCAFTTTDMPYSLQRIKKKKQKKNKKKIPKQICNYALHFFLVQNKNWYISVVRFLC